MPNKTIRFKNNDPRLTLFSDNHSFIAGTELHHIDTDFHFTFGGRDINNDVVFRSLGRNVMREGYKYLEAQDGHYYRFNGAIHEVGLPGFSQPMTLVLFSAFSLTGKNEGMVEFAKNNGVEHAFFALAYNPTTQTLDFFDSQYLMQCYSGVIDVINDNGEFMLINEI